MLKVKATKTVYFVDNVKPEVEVYPHNHLLVLTPSNPFRRLCVAISTSRAFDSFILLAITTNCVMMAMNAPLPNDDKSKLNTILEEMEVYLLGIFCVEAFFKIISQGLLFHPNSYLRNGWNILDSIVVITGILPYVGMNAAAPMKVVKAARVLRPLKLVSGVPSLQVVMSAILKSMASLLQICLLIGFVIVIYGLIGLSALKGSFHYTCFWNNTNIIWEDGILCGNRGRQCPVGTECKQYWSGPNYGITSFDNILISCITVFVCITCEGWTDTMYWTFDVIDYQKLYSWIYFYTLNIIGSQFMLNLVLGVLSGEFSKEKERVENRTAFLKQRQDAAAERTAEKYEGWVDEGEQAAAKELEEKLKRDQELEDAGEIVEAPLTGVQKFKTKNSIIRVKLKKIMLSSFMYWLVISLVFFNSVSGAIQHYKQPQWITDVIAISDNFFLGFFFSEMCLKLYALGPSLYFKSKFNKFDFVVVIAGLINWNLSKFAGVNLGIPVLRQLRLMRLFKITRYWGSLKNLIASILASMTSIISLLFLLFLFLMIFALLGMQLFGGQFKGTIPEPRTNFDDFFNAMLAVFQIITGEDWNVVMYEGIKAFGGPKDAKGLASSLYFIGVTVLGNYILLNVFLAIAVDNISLTADEKEQIAEEDIFHDEHMKEIREKENAIVDEKSIASIQDDSANKHELQLADATGPGDGFLENLKDPGRLTHNIIHSTSMLNVNTLFICFPGNPIRWVVHSIVSSPYFDNVILVLILISSALLAVEDVTDPEAKVNTILTYIDYGFTSIFAMEVILKIINFGFCLHPGSYCRDSWNFADMVVVCCAITSLVLSRDKDALPTVKTVVKILRILRVMRPLKSINKLPKLKAVFQCMIFSLKNVVNVLMITLQFLLIFSIMGVQLFSGKLFYCSDPAKFHEEECVGMYIATENDKEVEKERMWKLHSFHFNNVGAAMLTLFTSSTGEGWPAVMQTGMDSQEEHQGPLRNNKVWVAIYFIIFVIIFSFFFINLFVGMIILTFQEQGAAAAGGELDRNARNSLQIAMRSKPAKRHMPEDVKSVQYKAWVLIDSTAWEMFIMFLIFINTIAMLIQYFDQPIKYGEVLVLINDVIGAIFCLEFALKFYALRCNYFKDFWNIFDLVIVLTGLVDTFFRWNSLDLPVDFTLFRLLRIVKLLRRIRSLRILIWTFIKSFKALPYVGMLIYLLFFVYAIIGMQLFALISINNDEEPYAQINRNNNFRSYFSSTQLLFRVATGENWPNIMLACTSKARCDKDLKAFEPGHDHCGSFVAYLYFISFVFFCSFLMLNLFIAVIMDNFAFLTEDSSILGPHHLDEVVTVWSEFDPRASGRVRHTEICEMLRRMMPPLGLGTKCSSIVAYKRMVKMNMTLYKNNTVDYNGTFFALVRTGLDIHTKNANLKSNDQACRKMLKETWPNISKRTLDLVIPKTPKNGRHMTVGKIYSAKLIWENYKILRKEGRHRRALERKKILSECIR